jgi:predicted nucleic acid-binding Zn ribbon protein
MALVTCQECGKDVSSEAAACPHCGYSRKPQVKKKKRFRWSVILITVILALLAVMMLGKIGEHAPAEMTESEKKANAKFAIEANKRFEECRAWLKKDQLSGLIYDLEWKRAMPKVVVGSTFYSIPIDEKQGLADRVNCFLNAGKGSYIDFDILDWQTGKRVAQYSLGRLKMD